MSAHWLILLLIVIIGICAGLLPLSLAEAVMLRKNWNQSTLLLISPVKNSMEKGASTIGRKASSIRGFCRFLFMERRQDKDISQNTQTPKRQRPLPQVLSQEEMDKLLALPDTSTVAGMPRPGDVGNVYGVGCAFQS